MHHWNSDLSVDFYLGTMFEEVRHVFIHTEGFATSSSASHLQSTVILPWKIIQIAAHKYTSWKPENMNHGISNNTGISFGKTVGSSLSAAQYVLDQP